MNPPHAADACQLAQNLARNCRLPVFPCAWSNKRPTRPKDEGGEGFKDASTDPDRIAWLWHNWPGQLIGVACGEASGISVLDIDIKADSARAWWLENQHRLPVTRTFRTRGGGLHAMFLHAPGVRNVEGKPVAGVDCRGQGGYVIWWFAAGLDCLDHAAPAPWPDWLSRFFWPPPKPAIHHHNAPVALSDADLERIKTRAIDRIRSAADGQRHYRLRASARLLGGIQRRAGFADADAIGWLIAAVPGQNTNPDADEKTVRWGLENGRALPIEVRP